MRLTLGAGVKWCPYVDDAAPTTTIFCAAISITAVFVVLAAAFRCDRAEAQTPAPAGAPNVKTKAVLAECGGTPDLVGDCYALRSPLDHMTRFGDARMPLILWWSARDPIAGSVDESPAYLATLHADVPWPPSYARIGTWEHGRAWWTDGERLWLRDALAVARTNPQRRAVDFG